MVFAVGTKAAKIADGAADSGGITLHFATKEEALPEIREQFGERTAMRRALVADGVDPARLLLEERSSDTEENFAYSKALLAKHGIDTDTAVIAVVTNDFHIRRACLIAGREGLTTLGVPAELPWWWLSANYYVREFFGLGKLLL